MGSPTEGHLLGGARLEDTPYLHVLPHDVPGDVRWGLTPLVTMIDRGARDRDAATAFGVDAGLGEHADLHRGIAGQSDPDMAELSVAIDLRQYQSHAADDIGAVVAADPHGRAGA